MKIFIATLMLSAVTIALKVELVNGQSLAFPDKGQSEEQQTLDFQQCNEQAREETDFDPAKPLKRENDGQVAPDVQNRRQQQLQTYNQILSNCLKQRGYTLR
jgi:hypothetical protein